MERPYPFLSDDGGKFHLVPFITRHVRGAIHCFGALNTPIVVYTWEQRIFNKIRVLALNEI